jgi:hypothetical protein
MGSSRSSEIEGLDNGSMGDLVAYLTSNSISTKVNTI